jgi:hypothetical protein
MTEITERDRVAAEKALGGSFRSMGRVAEAIAVARQEGQQEERALWRGWLDRMQKLQELKIEEDFDLAPDKCEVAG